MARAFGIPATQDRNRAEVVASRCEAAGYTSVWTNDGAADGVATAGWMAEATERIRIGIGVVACDRVPAGDLIKKVEAENLALDRVVLGIGSGFSANPTETVKVSVDALREAFGRSLRIAVAAMGPRMCATAGEVADVVLLNWMTPERIRWATRQVSRGSSKLGNSPEIASYIRVAVGAGAAERIEQEASRYAAIPHYAKHFQDMRVAAGEVGVAAAAEEVGAALLDYEALLDEAVVRAVPASEDLDSTVEILEAAAPR